MSTTSRSGHGDRSGADGYARARREHAGQLAGAGAEKSAAVADGMPVSVGASRSAFQPGDSRLSERGNAPVRIAAMQRAQHTYGNRAVQRYIRRRGGHASSAGKPINRAPQPQLQAQLQPQTTLQLQPLPRSQTQPRFRPRATVGASSPARGLTTAEVVSMVAGTPIQRWATSARRIPAVQRQGGNPVAPPDVGTSIHPTLQVGSRGPAVEELQEKLRSLGIRVIGQLISVDGIFGPRTRDAVRIFQRQQGLSVTGICDAATWDRMDAAGARSTVGRVEREWSEVVGGVTYGMTSRYTWRIIGNEIRITVKLKFTGLRRPALIQQWFNHIRNIWNRFKVVNPATRQAINIEFDPQQVTSGEDNVVQIVPGNGRSDAGRWFAGDPDSNNTAAHEFGHMVGLEDEYQRTHTDYRRLTGRDPGAGQTGPGGLLGALQAAWIATELRSALLDPNQANRISRATAVVTGNNLQQGNYAQEVATSYQTMYGVNVVDDIVAHIPAANQWSIVDPFTHSSQTIMGMGGDHTHPVEPRHVREFAEAVSRAKGGVWRTEPR